MTETPVFLKQRDLAVRWKLSIRTLERWRVDRYGPAWITIGGSIRYSITDVQAFEAEQRCTSPTTTDESVKSPQK